MLMISAISTPNIWLAWLNSVMAFATVKGTYLPEAPESKAMFDNSLAPGSFWYGEITVGNWTGPCIWILIPRNDEVAAKMGVESEHHVHCCPIEKNNKPDLENKSSWWWDGNIEKPTMTPSIRCWLGEHETWHGHMTAGILEGCE